MDLKTKFNRLGIDNAPGQEDHQNVGDIKFDGDILPGFPVDFSHGDVDAHPPIPGTLQTFVDGVHFGSRQAYTEYRGKKTIRDYLADKISDFTGCLINPDENIILTPGTQGALFLAVGA